MKQRMNSADIAAEAACVAPRIEGMRVSNVYDLNAKVCGEKREREATAGERAVARTQRRMETLTSSCGYEHADVDLHAEAL